MNESVDVYLYISIIVIIYLFFCFIHFICNKMEDKVYNNEEEDYNLSNYSNRNLNRNLEYIEEVEKLPIYSKKVLQNEKQIIPALPSYKDSLCDNNIDTCIFIHEP